MAEFSAESRALLDSVLASSADAIMVVNADREIVTYNEIFMKLWDLPEGAKKIRKSHEMVELVLDRLVDPERLLQSVQKVWSNPNQKYEFSIELRNGQIMEYSTVPWLLEGKYAGRVITFRDSTARKRAEEELRLSEMRFRTIFESAAFGMTLFDLSGQFVACNPAFCKMVGYTESELKTIGIAGVSDPKEFATENKLRLQEVALGKIDSFELDKPYIRKDGSRFQGHLTTSIVRNSAGLARYGIGMIYDVTQQRVAEQALRRSEESLRESQEFLKNVLAHSPVIVGAIDMKGIIRLSEGKGLEILGRKPGELVGRSVVELFKDQPKSRENIRRVLEGEEFGAVMVDPIGHLIWETRWSPLKDSEGKLQGAIAVSVNVTERERLANQREHLFRQEQSANQAARQAIHDRDEFMAIASHELRTPITPLKMQLQFLNRHLTTGRFSMIPEAKDVLKVIRISEQQLDRLGRLIEDMLHASRMNVVSLSLNREPIDLSELVQEVVARYRPEAQRSNCPIHLHLERSLVGHWDRFRVDQVVVNLLTNAMKYGAGNPIDVITSRRGETAILTIRDHGIGIDPKHHEKIFDQFHRVGPVNAYGGFGLGLYIARQIVSAHGGSIRVQSAPGEGATFTVELPLGNSEK